MKLDINYIKNYLRNVFQDAIAVYSEKGMEPFKKPFVISMLIIICSYLFYKTSSSRLLDNREKVEWFNSIKDYYNEYVSSKEILKKYATNVPAWKDKDDFLSYTLTNIASKNGITFSSVETQKEMPYDRIYYVSKQVRFTTTFENLVKFLAEVERSEILVEVSQITITKRESTSQLGLLDVDLIVGTIFINL
ncbi:MAG: type 4a pilus biogenesis protein PilO [Candidatus Anstonellales archaeon]